MMNELYYVLLGLVAFLAGSIPFAFIVVRVFRGQNVMEHGTGNVGTMNTHRATNSKVLSGLVLLGDVGKGMFAYLMAEGFVSWFDLNSEIAYIVAGTLVVLGHNHSVFLKFKGGKGLATGAGYLFLLSPWLVGIWVGLWLIVTFPTRIMVLGQILATVFTPVLAWFMVPEFKWVTLCVSIPIFIKHSPRIRNVLDGSEPKMYFKERDAEQPEASSEEG